MKPKIENSYGRIVISNRVIATISKQAIKSCYGVVGIAAAKLTESMLALVTGRSQKKGISIMSEPDGVTIELWIVVEYGVNINAVSEIVMQSVKYQVESLTGFTVKQVSVNVAKVRVDEGRNKS